MDKVNSHLDNVEEKIGEHEGIAIEMIQNETERKKSLKEINRKSVSVEQLQTS